VALHALADALLGAMALGDIGHFFPDNDPAWRGADSAELLAAVYAKVQASDFRLGNADVTIICQQPKIAPYVLSMRQRIADLLAVDVGCIAVKATTTETLGFTGRGEGIAVMAIALLESHD